ncbi:MAG: Glutathione transport system permease protein GsiC [Anaerolineales bacterium]|nr:Glutathione transport system permease protein GsiC [Anaerolineales bacterium]
MSRYIAQRLLAAVLTLIGVSVIVFVLVRLAPGDPARVIAGLLAAEEDVQRIRVKMGLDQPLPVQYAMFFGRMIQGDLGTSARTREPVLGEVLDRLPATMKLALISMTMAGIVGVVGGVAAAYRRNSKLDFVISVGTLFGISMPVYWLGLMLIVLFAVRLHWLPAAGSAKATSYVMPSLTLAAFSVALVARMTRSSMLEVLGEDYVRTARAKGVREQVVVLRHALKNALIPVITVIGLQFGALLGGAVLTETVFGWPGMGRLLVDSIFARDYPMVQGIVLIFSFLFVAVNLLIDITYAYIDPRIHYD